MKNEKLAEKEAIRKQKELENAEKDEQDQDAPANAD